MEIYEITGYQTGTSQAGVNFLQPSDSFVNMQDGYIYRQVLQSRQGMTRFAARLADKSRVYGIFEHTLPDSSKELLAVDKNFLYKYNVGTGVFDQIAFGGSLAAYAGFNITSDEDYVSGTSYPTATNAARFVFTGKGMDHVFFYDGTNVLDFTSVADNPNYQQPALGALTNAHHVFGFGERLNLIYPIIAGTGYSQGMLFSGIRTASGNGDKFNAVGSGLLQLDTYENIAGAKRLGDEIVLSLDRSNWTIEKTTDAFNPYFSKRMPGVLGTNADFSPVVWGNTLKSIGQTGILVSDGRQTLRNDNKIPNFTLDEMLPSKFQHIYGGFDRTNNQFLWSYVQNESDSTTQDGILVNNYEFDTWAIYNMRTTCFGETIQGLDLTWDDIDETAGNPSWAQWDTTEDIWNEIGLAGSVQKTLAGDNLGFIYDLHANYSDYSTQITGISQAALAVFTVEESAYRTGDLVVVQNAEGMTEINNYSPVTNPSTFTPYTVISATDISITLDVDSTLFTAYTTGGTLTKLISFYAETIPFNPYRAEGRKCFISHVDFLIDTNGGYLKVDVIADEEDSPFKSDVLLLPTSTLKARQWITLSVDCEAEFFTFVLRQQSPDKQLKLTSMRIFAERGGLTSG